MSIYDEIRQRTDLTEWTDLPIGKKIKCPFCGSGKSPSFKITPDYFICFKCGAKGDLFNWVARQLNGDDWDAAQHIAERLGLKINDAKPEENPAHEQYRALAEQYHEELTPEAREYLHGRGLTDETIAEKLIGWVPDNEGRPAPEGFDVLREAGLPGILSGRVLIPFWRRGRIVYVTGRAISAEKEPKYMNQRGKKTHAGTVRGPELIVCEGPLDQLLAEQAGYNCVAMAGSGGRLELTPGVKDVLLAFDPDEAGERYTREFIPAMAEQGAKVDVLRLPEGHDLADVLAGGGKVADLERVSGFDWLAERLLAAPKDKALKKDCYRVMAHMDHLDQDEAVRVVKKILNVSSLAVVKQDFAAAMKEAVEDEFYDTDTGAKYIVPDGYVMGKHGILDTRAKTPRVTNAPVFVTRTGRDNDGAAEYVELKYKSGVRFEKRIISRDKIAVSQSLVKESAHGVPVNSANVLDLVRYLDEWMAANPGIHGIFSVTKLLGWQSDGSGFVFSDEVV